MNITENQIKSIMLTPSAQHVSLERLDGMLHPSMGPRHKPMAFAWLVRHVLAQLAFAFPGVEPHVEMVVNNLKDGHHLLCIIRFGETGPDGLRRVIALRSSDNQDFGVLVAAMAEFWMCCNGQVSEGGLRHVKKNTLYNAPEFEYVVEQTLLGYESGYARLVDDKRLLERKPVTEIRGAELLGIAEYDGIIKPQQASIMRKEWRSPGSSLPKLTDGSQDPRVSLWQEAWQERNFHTLDMAITEGLKKGGIADRIERHSEAHDFIMDAALAA